jgi:hypothetical protein
MSPVPTKAKSYHQTAKTAPGVLRKFIPKCSVCLKSSTCQIDVRHIALRFPERVTENPSNNSRPSVFGGTCDQTGTASPYYPTGTNHRAGYATQIFMVS